VTCCDGEVRPLATACVRHLTLAYFEERARRESPPPSPISRDPGIPRSTAPSSGKYEALTQLMKGASEGDLSAYGLLYLGQYIELGCKCGHSAHERRACREPLAYAAGKDGAAMVCPCRSHRPRLGLMVRDVIHAAEGGKFVQSREQVRPRIADVAKQLGTTTADVYRRVRRVLDVVDDNRYRWRMREGG